MGPSMGVILALVPCGFVPNVPPLWRRSAAQWAHENDVSSAVLRQPLRRLTVATMLNQPPLDGTGAFKDIQEYPCTLEIKIIGDNEGPFVSDLVTLAAEATGMAESDILVRWRDKGRFRSVTLKLNFENSDQVYAVYAAMDRDPRVRYKL